jgi:hypothetical protein
MDRLREAAVHDGEDAVAQRSRGVRRRDELKVIFLKSGETAGLEEIAAVFEDG